MNSIRERTAKFAGFVKGLGFTVYIAKAGTHGFITDVTETRVLSFSLSDFGSLSGNYGPPSQESGMGWRLAQEPSDLRTAEDVRRALYAHPDPRQCGHGWKYFSSVKQYLAMYGESSQYEKI